MTKPKKKVGIFLYNRLFDPLIQSNFWLYITDFLNSDSDLQLYLITYENPDFPLNTDQQKLVDEWIRKGLEWKQLRWNPGIGLVPKLLDIFQGFRAVGNLRLKGYEHVISLGSVAGTFVYLYSLLLRIRFFLYQFEPHSEYAIDNGMWSEKSYQYRISHLLERKAAHAAQVIASGTKFMEERLKGHWQVNASFFKIPTVANDHKFLFNEENRRIIRGKLGISPDTFLLFYPGKFGDLYYREETAFMYKWLKEEIPKLHFLIVTPHKDQEVKVLFDNAGVPAEQYTIAHADYEEIHMYYSAADFAVIAVPPGPSKKFISNIKVGEYLCAGLPFLITEGVSEDYVYAKERKVGVVVKDFKEPYVRSATSEILAFLSMNKTELREHCRKEGLNYRGFNKLNKIFKQAVYKLLS